MRRQFWVDTEGARAGDLIRVSGLSKFFEVVDADDAVNLVVRGYGGRSMTIPRHAITAISKMEGRADVSG